MSERIPMVNVTARILDQTGRPVQRARITMRLTTIERYCGLIVPREVTQYTDADGLAVLRVWPNELGTECSEYMVTIMYGDATCRTSCASGCGANAPTSALSQRFRVVVPNCDCNLFDITDLPPYEQRGSGQVITSEVANWANQAAASADKAQAAVTAVESCRADAEKYAQEAKASKEAAADSAGESLKQANRAQTIVDGIDATILHFETCVVQKTEQLANKVGQEAVACIKQAETSALEAIDTRASEELAEISRLATQGKCSAREAITAAKENALDEIGNVVRQAEEDFREEAGLFGADFEALTERAENAAKRAGCSAASASNSATRACLCADRAEKAADGIDRYQNEVMMAVKQVETAKACADASAQRAERAADMVQQNVEYAAGSAKAAQEAAKAADCSAGLAKESADICLATQQAVKADKEEIVNARQGMEELVERSEETSKLVEAIIREADEILPTVKADADRAEAAAEITAKNAAKTDADVKACSDAVESIVRDAEETRQNAEMAKEAAENAHEDREAAEAIARDVEQTIHDTALDMLTEQVVNEAVEQATSEAKEAAEEAKAAASDVKSDADRAEAAAGLANTKADQAAESAEAAADRETEAARQANYANIRAERALAAQKAAEEAAKQAEDAAANPEVEALVASQAELMGQHIALSDMLTVHQLKHIEEKAAMDAMISRLCDRVMKLELTGGNGDAAEAIVSPAGYETPGGAKVAPVTVTRPGAVKPADAAFTIKLSEINV